MSNNSNWRNFESSSLRGIPAPKGRGYGATLTPVPPRTPARGSPATPVPRSMGLIASVSRSGGLEGDGDDLKNVGVQDEYRKYIQEKLEGFWEKYPRRPVISKETEEESQHRVNAQENVLILFRKLREGIIASKRVGSFADEVYETSLYLSVLFDSPRHISAIVPALLTHLLLPLPFPFLLPTTQPQPQTQRDQARNRRTQHEQAVLVALLQHLVADYPSQRAFHTYLASVSKDLLPPGSKVGLWVTSVASCIRAGNYARLERLMKQDFLELTDTDADHKDNSESASQSSAKSKPESKSTPERNLAHEALHHLVDALRNNTREMSWRVIRTAYRELHLQSPSSSSSTALATQLSTRKISSGREKEGQKENSNPNPSSNASLNSKTDASDTRRWLQRSLGFESDADSDSWLDRERELEHVVKKEGAGMEGRWTVCKPR